MQYDQDHDRIVCGRTLERPISIIPTAITWQTSVAIEVSQDDAVGYLSIGYSEIDDLIAGLIEARRRMYEADPDATELEVIEWHKASDPPDGDIDALIDSKSWVGVGYTEGTLYYSGASLVDDPIAWADLPRGHRRHTPTEQPA